MILWTFTKWNLNADECLKVLLHPFSKQVKFSDFSSSNSNLDGNTLAIVLLINNNIFTNHE